MKKTKKMMFTELRTLVADNADMVAFIDHELELLDKKKSGSRKPTKTQQENLVYKEEIYKALVDADEALTISELREIVPSISGFNSQKIAPILAKLVIEGLVTRETIKKVTYYRAVA